MLVISISCIHKNVYVGPLEQKLNQILPYVTSDDLKFARSSVSFQRPLLLLKLNNSLISLTDQEAIEEEELKHVVRSTTFE